MKKEPKYTTSNLDNEKYKDFSVAKQRAKNYMRLKDGYIEPKDVVLGDKTSLDAQMLDKLEPKQETLEEVECNNCGYLMSLTEDESVYACYNSECTSCYEEYEEEPKQETLEEAAERLYTGIDRQVDRMLFIKGAKWQQKRMYSEEDMKQFGLYLGDNLKKLKGKSIDEIFEQFKNI